MRSILVAINGFPAAETTVSMAAGLASALMARLCILHVRCADTAGAGPSVVADLADRDGRQDLIAELLHWSAMLSDATATEDGSQIDPAPAAALRRAAELAQRAGVVDVLTCLTTGDPVEVILAQTRQTNADLLVIGRGRSPNALGQTAAALVRRCPCALTIAGRAPSMH